MFRTNFDKGFRVAFYCDINIHLRISGKQQALLHLIDSHNCFGIYKTNKLFRTHRELILKSILYRGENERISPDTGYPYPG